MRGIVLLTHAHGTQAFIDARHIPEFVSTIDCRARRPFLGYDTRSSVEWSMQGYDICEMRFNAIGSLQQRRHKVEIFFFSMRSSAD